MAATRCELSDQQCSVLEEKYHADGLRVDASPPALSRLLAQAGEWIPNEHGGRENLEAIHFLRALNHESTSASPTSR